MARAYRRSGYNGRRTTAASRSTYRSRSRAAPRGSYGRSSRRSNSGSGRQVKIVIEHVAASSVTRPGLGVMPAMMKTKARAAKY